MTDEQKMLEYYVSAVGQVASNKEWRKPTYVPSRVLILGKIEGDGPCKETQVGPGESACVVNRLGAVSVLATNGEMLGLRLHEFRPIAWRKNK